MRTGNAVVRKEFLERSRRIDEIRSAVYLSGTLVRDYLLEPDPAAAERQLVSLRALRKQMDAELRDYSSLLPANEAQPVASLRTELDAYWRSHGPASTRLTRPRLITPATTSDLIFI